MVLRNTTVGVLNYPGRIPARFNAVLHADAQIGSSDDVVAKVVFTGLHCH